MNKYFVSYTFNPIEETNFGGIGFGCNIVETKFQIRGMEDIYKIIEVLENDEIGNVVIMNIQKMPI